MRDAVNLLKSIRWLVLVSGILFLSWQACEMYSWGRRHLSSEIPQPAQRLGALPVPEPRKPFLDFAEHFKSREIFKTRSFSAVSSQDEEKNVLSEEELRNSLKLLGIMISGTPEAIVKDIETNETLFLHKGDYWKEAMVEGIEPGQVIFLVGENRLVLKQ